jgi:hypothetical protein
MKAMLGCVKSNVSRLARALEQLRLVAIDCDVQLVVVITKAGRALVEQILAATGQDVDDVATKCDVVAEQATNDTQRCEPPGGQEYRASFLGNILRKLRNVFSDTNLFDIYSPGLFEHADRTRLLIWNYNAGTYRRRRTIVQHA